MKLQEKITIASGLSLGLFAAACSIARTIELQSISSIEDYVYVTSDMLLWSSSQVCLTIVCACIPVLRPLYIRVRYGSQASSRNKSKHSVRAGLGGMPTSQKGRTHVRKGSSGVKMSITGDAASEETIWREQGFKAGAEAVCVDENWEHEDGITMTRDITVTTSAARVDWDV